DATVTGVQTCALPISGKLSAQTFDAIEPFQVTDTVLSHGALPSVHAIEERFCLHSNNFAKLLSHRSDNFCLRPHQRFLVAPPTDEASQQRTILRCAVGKLVVDKGAGQHALAFALWDKEPEPGGKSSAHFLIVGEIHCNRRGVCDALQLGGQLPTRDFQKDRGYVRRDRKSTRLNSSHGSTSYAVFCLKKKIIDKQLPPGTAPALTKSLQPNRSQRASVGRR